MGSPNNSLFVTSQSAYMEMVQLRLDSIIFPKGELEREGKIITRGSLNRNTYSNYEIWEALKTDKIY